MALLYVDGFDVRDTALRWSAAPISYVTGRFGTGSAMWINVMGRSFTPASTFIMGFAYYQANGGSSGFREFIRLNGDAGATTHLTLQQSGLDLVLARGGVTLATASSAIPAGSTFNYIEIKATIADSGGNCQVRVNGVQVINFTGDTKNAGTATTIDSILFLTVASGGSPVSYVDDLYICDGTGTLNNDFLGDVRVQTLVPTGAGNTTQLTASTGANWTCVDETPYSATDFVSGSTTGNKDTYATSDLPAAATSVKAVQLGVVAKKTDAGTRLIKPVVRSGGTDYTGTGTALTNSDITALRLLETDPATSSAWTISAVNAAEIGVEVA